MAAFMHAIGRAFCAVTVLLAVSAAAAAPAAEKPKGYLLHLNGIGGERVVDHWLVEGLKAGGVGAEIEIYDWTGGQVGVEALQGRQRHQVESKKIAEKLAERARRHPGEPIYLTGHSGGCGLAVWALEQLPADVKVDSLYMFAPALSPNYDLSKALAHVTGKLHVFSSSFDVVVLGTGTKLFGTIDGQRVEAAGLRGFVRPESGNEKQYEKLAPHPYRRSWLARYWNDGTHIGCLRPLFVRDYVTPILLNGSAPMDVEDEVAARAATTRPAAPIAAPRSSTATPSMP